MNMTVKFSPGPWQTYHDHGWLVVESDNGDLYVKIEKGSAARKRMADAHLIAAAPDLLEALSKLTDMYCRLVNSSDCGNWNPEDDIEVKEAREAIAKATYKEP